MELLHSSLIHPLQWDIQQLKRPLGHMSIKLIYV